MRYTEGRPWPSEMSQPINPPPRRIWPFVLLGVLVLMCCGISLPLIAATLDEDRSAAVYVSEPPAGVVTTSVPQKGAPPAISDGQWIVGEDVQAGRYKTEGADPDLFTMCVWTVYAKEGGNAVDFGTSGEANAPGRVVLKKGQFFDTTGCQPWVRQAS